MARPHPSLYDIAAGRTVRPVAESEAFVESAVEHRMAGLALWATTKADFGLDAAAKQVLAAHKLQVAAQSIRLKAIITSVLHALGSHGMAAAVFKGVATESRWYPGPGTRPAADIDLFLDPASHGRLDEIIQLFQPSHALAGAAQRLFGARLLQGFDVDHDGIWVDVHTDPIKVGVPLPRVGELWERTEVEDLDGIECRVLDKETSLLQAMIHLEKDPFSELQALVDAARIVDAGVDWDWLQSFARDAGLGVHLNQGLRVVGEALDLEIPFDPAQSSTLWRRLWPEESRLLGKAGMSRKVRTHYWIPFTMKGRRREALRWWSRLVFPPPEMIAYLHPEAKGPYLWKLLSYRGKLAWSRHRRNVEQRHDGALES